MQRSQFKSQSAASSNHPLAAVQSDLAISMYGYGLAAKRVAATEGLTPRSARACITFRARSSRALSRPRPARSATTTPRSASSPSLDNHWGLRPKQKFDVRAQLAVGSQHLMEVADVSYLHTADLVATDGRSCCNGSIMVHESASLDSTLVAQLTAHTRLHVVDSCWLDDHTKRALIVVEGDDEPLGWATAITSDGIPLIYLFARPLYEVAKQPLKVRYNFEQTSKFRRQLAVGTRFHVIETRKTSDGAQRVCVVVLGEDDPAGWVTSIKLDGKRTLKEVLGLDGGSSPRLSPQSLTRQGSFRSDEPRYAHMSSESLDRAAREFISQRQTFIASSILRAAMNEVIHQGAEVTSRLQTMETTFLEGGEKPLSVQLAEILKDRPFSLEDMMAEAETSGSNPAVTGKIAKMEFRMYIRKLLNQRCMLSSMTGAAEIDAIFPMLDVNNDGEIDIEELEKALIMMEQERVEYQEKVAIYKRRDEKYKHFAAHLESVFAVTLAAEEAIKDREAETQTAIAPMLGAAILAEMARNGWTTTKIASLWMGEMGVIDKAGFRSRSLALGFESHVTLVDQLFDSLCRGPVNAEQLEQALAELIRLAQAQQPKLLQLNIRIIDSTKSMKAAQAEHHTQMEVWSAYRKTEEERAARERAELEAIARLSKQEKAKLNASASTKGSKSKSKTSAGAAPAARAPARAK